MRKRFSPSIRVCQTILGLLTLVAPFAGAVHADPDVVDGVAALVNNDVITFSQVRELVGASVPFATRSPGRNW